MLQRALGTAREWGELEQSAAMETANIVGCAFLNSLAAHLPGSGAGARARRPPRLRRGGAHGGVGVCGRAGRGGCVRGWGAGPGGRRAPAARHIIGQALPLDPDLARVFGLVGMQGLPQLVECVHLL